jgi:uncharacterized protein YfdQ (DUF2303 family)
MDPKNPTITRTETDALSELVQQMHHAEVHDVQHPDGTGTIKVLVVPQGREVQSLKEIQDEYRLHPERRRGNIVTTSLDSFSAAVNRYKDKDTSVLFALMNGIGNASLLAVLDYHPPGPKNTDARHGEHRVSYAFPVSDEWKAWTAKAGRFISQEEFADFLEERIPDVCDPAEAGPNAKKLAAQLGIDLATPGVLLQLSRSLHIRVGQRVVSHHNLSTGEAQIAFEEKHESAEGGPLKIPGGFVIGIPPFKQDVPYHLPVRLRYRVVEGKVTWMFAVQRIDAAWEDAVKRACNKVQTDTALPLMFGSP